LKWIWDPKIKSITLAYFSFSNSTVRKALCQASVERGLKVTLYIHMQNIASVSDWTNCPSGLGKVIERGRPFGTTGGYLQHAKMFYASEVEDPLPLSMVSDEELRGGIKDTTFYFTSTSGNLSSNGTSLHFDNWIVFESKYENRLAQENLCFIH